MADICIPLFWANGMSSVIKNRCNFPLLPVPLPKLVYKEIIEYYPCSLSLAWVLKGKRISRLGKGICAISVLRWLCEGNCSATGQSYVGTADSSKWAHICQADSLFRHHVPEVHDLSLTKWFWKYFLSLLFPFGAEVLMATFEIKIYVCMDLAYKKAVVHLSTFQAPSSCICTM